MTTYLNFAGSLVASAVALTIAILGWRKSDKRTQKDHIEAVRKEQAAKLAELLELGIDAAESRHLDKHNAKMKAILLTLPGHLATVLRARLKLRYTMLGVSVDPASAARLRSEDPHDAENKWLIFDRSSIRTGREFEPFAEWIEAELAYDITRFCGTQLPTGGVKASWLPRAATAGSGPATRPNQRPEVAVQSRSQGGRCD